MLYLASRTSIRGLGRVIALAALTAGVALAGFSFLRIFPLALLFMALVGAGVILSAASANTILQTIVDDRMRGRVSAYTRWRSSAWRRWEPRRPARSPRRRGAADAARQRHRLRPGRGVVLAPAAGVRRVDPADLTAARIIPDDS
jgi:hypothetical protein